jgi:uncharacterized protein (TIGR00297 family)
MGAVGYSRGALDGSGVAGAVAVGTPIFLAGSLRWSVLLLAFFGSSSALSRVGRRRKAAAAAEFSKGERRDLGQALANGGVAAACAAVSLARPSWPMAAAVAGALAEANADTWATELGTLSRRPPRLITTGRVVPPGTSGGVTRLGVAAATGGALAVALPAALLVREQERAGASRVRLLCAVTLAGVAGSLADSALGATWQAMYWCPGCETWTERQVHRCGTATELRRGLAWLDNDVVNALATLTGALLALAGLVAGSRSDGR